MMPQNNKKLEWDELVVTLTGMPLTGILRSWLTYFEIGSWVEISTAGKEKRFYTEYCLLVNCNWEISRDGVPFIGSSFTGLNESENINVINHDLAESLIAIKSIHMLENGVLGIDFTEGYRLEVNREDLESDFHWAFHTAGNVLGNIYCGGPKFDLTTW